MKKSEECLKDLWDTIKHPNISIIKVLKGQKREWGRELILRNNGWNPSNMR